LAVAVLVLGLPIAAHAESKIQTQKDNHSLRIGSGSFTFTGSAGARKRPVKVWYHRPQQWRKGDPILFVMHGTGRTGRNYREVWTPQAERRGFLLIVPEFSRRYYPRSEQYHQGNLFTRRGTPIDSVRWSFTTVERLFDDVKQRSGATRASYWIYGHSAGSQFVHRMLLLMPHARIEKAVLANAGWYTLPTLEAEYPYGLDDALERPEWRIRLRSAFRREVPVLVGAADTIAKDRELRTTSEARAQGKHRLERGQTFFRTAHEQARRMNVPFRWYIRVVPGAGHSNRDMAQAAAAILTRR
jgi:hypothetical protein